MIKCLPVVVVSLFFIGCSGGSHEAITREYLDVMSHIVNVCETIKDKDSAKAAQPKLGELLANLRELKTRAKEIGKINDSVQRKIDKKYDAEMEKLSVRYSTAVQAIVDSDECSTTLESELKTLATLLNSRFTG
jgi:hypothetical protein